MDRIDLWRYQKPNTQEIQNQNLFIKIKQPLIRQLYQKIFN